MASKNSHITIDDFAHVEGNCWACYATLIPPAEGNSNESPRGSCWELREDDVPLRAHAFFPDIVDVGLGRYAHSGATVYFSSTDNSDPRKNARNYTMHKVAVTHRQPKRHSINALYKSLPKIFTARLKIIFENSSDTHPDLNDFWGFYNRSVEKWDRHQNGMLLSTIFLKYCEHKFFSRWKDKWQSPSVEIAVANGYTSLLALNYPFDLGTEVFFSMLEAEAQDVPHKKIARFNLNAPTDIGQFKTVVMIHSIDDFSEPDPQIAFKALYELLEPGGSLYLSGFTDHYCDIIRPFWPSNESFFQYRGLYEHNLFSCESLKQDAEAVGFRVSSYEEFNKGPIFSKLFALENHLSKYFYVNKIRNYIPNIIRKKLANILLNDEETNEGRGVNFFAVLIRD